VDLFGITPEEWMAYPDAWLGPVHPDDRDRVGEAFVAAMEAREPLRVEYRVVSADGVVRGVVDHAIVLPQVDGRPVLTQGVIFDISDRKRAEQEVEDSELTPHHRPIVDVKSGGRVGPPGAGLLTAP
jgi:PAS domain S-box-containing protein